jgi:hypothetical protein
VIGTEAFQAAFETARQSIFRLETLQFYAGDPNFDRFTAEETWEDTDSKQHWVDLVRRRVGDGVAMQRVHVVTEPWSDYVRFEITWSYPPNIAAGEDIRIITVPTPWPEPDFWIFDDVSVWLMHYTRGGVLERVEDVSAFAPMVAACQARKERALRTAEKLPAMPHPR